jgi:hypothetical protein
MTNSWGTSALSSVAMTFGLLGCPASSNKEPANTQSGKKVEQPAKTTDPAEKPVDKELTPTPALATGCTVGYTPELVNGSKLWADVPTPNQIDNCNFHRLAYNNFLYLVGGGPTPRFLTELASTYGDLADTNTWPTAPTPIGTRGELQLGQAGDNFQLLDAAGQTVVYDVRINQTMWNAMLANGWNGPLTAAAAAFNADPATGGVWLPPNTGNPAIKDPSAESSINIKTSWRNYGKNETDCPAAIMYCTKDEQGDWLGLLGLHFVQKTATHGEWIWATFEHVANAPDCSPTLSTGQASSNPLQQNPRDPTNPSATINVNTGELAGQTGWSVFNFANYKTAGGDGTSCDFTKGTMHNGPGPCENPSGTPQCNQNPQDGKGGYQQINICRTEPIPDHSTPESLAAVCASATNPTDSVMNNNNVACLSQSVLDNWPADLDKRWKYYILVGSEWGVPSEGSPTAGTATGAPTVGCFNVTNTADPRDNFTCPTTTGATYPSVTTKGSVTLANTTMESWMQGIMCITYTLPNGAEQSLGTVDCMSCHQPDTLAPTQQSPHTNHGDMSHAMAAFAGDSPA